MNHDMENKLISCLELLEQGESVESILAQFPAEAEALRPFLETAAQLPDLASRPTLATQQQSHAAFLAQAASLASPQSSPVPFWVMLRRILMPVASLAVVLIFLSIGLISVSASALPGDGLYNVKRTVEAFRLQYASDPEQILELSEQARQERLREIEALLRAGKAADVMFEGEIELIDDKAWIISGLAVQLNKATIIDGAPQVGELAMVDGRTEDGLLLAGKIIILTGALKTEETPLPAIIPLVEPEDTPDPNVTPTATLTASPSPTPTRPTATPSPTPAQLPTETVELAPPPTATPGSTLVAPPPSDGNDHDNDSEGEGDSEGDNDNDGEGDSNDNDGEGDSNDNEGEGEGGDDSNDNEGGDENNDNEEANKNDEDDSDNANDDESKDSEKANENDEDDSDNADDDEDNSNKDDKKNKDEDVD